MKFLRRLLKKARDLFARVVDSRLVQTGLAHPYILFIPLAIALVAIGELGGALFAVCAFFVEMMKASKTVVVYA